MGCPPISRFAHVLPPAPDRVYPQNGPYLTQLAASGQTPAAIRVGMEAMGHYWMVLFAALSQAGYRPDLINSWVMAARRNITIRGTKTDRADATLMARLLRKTDLQGCAVAEGPRAKATGPDAPALRVRPASRRRETG